LNEPVIFTVPGPRLPFEARFLIENFPSIVTGT
jgi:hypothetical protein